MPPSPSRVRDSFSEVAIDVIHPPQPRADDPAIIDRPASPDSTPPSDEFSGLPPLEEDRANPSADSPPNDPAAPEPLRRRSWVLPLVLLAALFLPVGIGLYFLSGPPAEDSVPAAGPTVGLTAALEPRPPGAPPAAPLPDLRPELEQMRQDLLALRSDLDTLQQARTLITADLARQQDAITGLSATVAALPQSLAAESWPLALQELQVLDRRLTALDGAVARQGQMLVALQSADDDLRGRLGRLTAMQTPAPPPSVPASRLPFQLESIETWGSQAQLVVLTSAGRRVSIKPGQSLEGWTLERLDLATRQVDLRSGAHVHRGTLE